MRKEVVTPEQAMKLLTSSGAWPCLAHPMQYHLGYDQIRVLVGSLKEQGLRGLEVYHSSQNPYQSSKLREIAREFDLLPSGGSDFHGSTKPDIDNGVGRGGLRISYALLKDINEEICDQIEDKEPGSYLLMSKKTDDVFFEYQVDVMEDQFNLGYVDIHEGDKVYHADFD